MNKRVIELIKENGLMVILLFGVTIMFLWPSFQGKVHSELDMVQGKASATEILKYKKEGGHPGWTNSIFSGMPTTLIVGKSNKNKIVKVNYLTPMNSWTKYPVKILFLNFLGFFILMLAFGVKPKLAVVGSIAYGLTTFSISSIEAAHYTKVLAMGVMPMILGSMVLIFKRKYLFGFAFLAFNVALQTYYFHYQITFYTILVLLVFAVFYAINSIRQKQYKNLLIVGVLIIISGALGASTEYQKIQSTMKYSKNTMRGTNANLTANSNGKETTGLEPGYAFAWSYGIFESLTGVIPNMMGGSSRESIGENSKFVKTLRESPIDQKAINGFLYNANGELNKIPTYWGDLGMIPNRKGSQAFTGAPVYFGAIIILLFILGLITYKGEFKWAIIATTIMSFLLAWGRNFSILNDLLFDYLPFYNNFRTPMMAMTIAQMSIVLMAILGVDSWLKLSKSDQLKTLKKAGLIAGGIVFAFGILFLSFYEFLGPNDKQMQAVLKKAFKAQRESMVLMDALRSLLFMGAAFGVLWFYVKGSIKKLNHVFLFMGILILIDLGGVAKRYLPWSAFDKEANDKEEVLMSNADKEILKDKDLYYKVFDLSRNPFNDNTGANFHKMIGGYHPAKLSRYQDLISEHLAKQNPRVLDMLNTKYLIVAKEVEVGGRKTRIVQSERRNTNLGNAWFVDQIDYVNKDKKEIDFLRDFNPSKNAVANIKYQRNLGKITSRDSLASIDLVSYHPDTMDYVSNNSSEGIAVFSDLYYKDGWKAYVNGKPLEIGRANYILRSLRIPAGKNKIRFVFESTKEAKFSLSLISSITILLLLLGSIIYSYLNYNKKEVGS